MSRPPATDVDHWFRVLSLEVVAGRSVVLFFDNERIFLDYVAFQKLSGN